MYGDGKTTQKIAAQVNLESLGDLDLAGRLNLYPQAMRMTIRDAVIKFGGIEGIERLAKILRDMSSAEERDIKIKELRLELVDKEFVISHVFTYIDTLNKMILEVSNSVVDSIIALVLAEGQDSRQKVKEKIAASCGSIIRGAKTQVLTNMATLRAKFQSKDAVEDRLERIENALEDKTE